MKPTKRCPTLYSNPEELSWQFNTVPHIDQNSRSVFNPTKEKLTNYALVGGGKQWWHYCYYSWTKLPVQTKTFSFLSQYNAETYLIQKRLLKKYVRKSTRESKYVIDDENTKNHASWILPPKFYSKIQTCCILHHYAVILVCGSHALLITSLLVPLKTVSLLFIKIKDWNASTIQIYIVVLYHKVH